MSAVAPSRPPPWRHPWVRHLRLGFNLVLSPIYLWGVWLAGGSLSDPRLWIGWISLHVFLYGGTTAFNSFYDRDEGPISGMRRPEPVDAGLLWWSLAVQVAGLPLALLVGAPFTVAYLVLFVVAAAYSHPLTRWKAHPASALLAVALGQGGVGFLAGWWAVAAPSSGLRALLDVTRPDVLLGVLAAALVLSGIYVVTQSFQTVEDRRRADRTLPVVWGPGLALRRAAVVSGAGVLLIAWMVTERLHPAWSAVVVAGALAVGVPWWRWADRFDESDQDGNYLRAMRIAGAGGAGLSAFLLIQLLLQ